jgi:hypothetical protein
MTAEEMREFDSCAWTVGQHLSKCAWLNFSERWRLPAKARLRLKLSGAKRCGGPQAFADVAQFPRRPASGDSMRLELAVNRAM